MFIFLKTAGYYVLFCFKIQGTNDERGSYVLIFARYGQITKTWTKTEKVDKEIFSEITLQDRSRVLKSKLKESTSLWT